ncbi:MAG: ATP-dependent RecD-like DNA helicase [Victivallales bacterium]|nr:ATP-dependent RecD-like DNA helicase [Victivallales bacterium]
MKHQGDERELQCGAEPLHEVNEKAVDEQSYSTASMFHLNGEVKRVVYESPDSDYAVLRLTDSHGMEQTLVGDLKNVLEGQTIDAVGKWESHREHGRQFHVQSYQSVLPSTAEGIQKYLSSGILPGIGDVYAKRIVEHFGAETLEILDNYSERLKEVPGIGRKRIDEIRNAWQMQSSQRQTDVYLQGLGISPAFCKKIRERYGEVTAAEIVRRNPYRLAAEISGIGFLSADKIAAKLGIANDSPLRLCAGMVYTLEEFQGNGHVCVTKEQLLASAKEKLSVGEPELESGLAEALAQGQVISEVSRINGDKEMFFTRQIYQAETELAEAVNVLLAHGAARLNVSAEWLGEGFARLNEAQKQGVVNAFTWGFSIITGGPGVGKTTVVGQIVALAKRLRMTMMLAAPTGRASKRMSEATGESAQTIHRLLKWDAQKHGFAQNADNPLDCRLLIIDEVSMLDTQLAASLFRAVRPGTHVVLVGDKDQLPSVGPGAVLHDLIACGRIPVSYLREIYRQADGSRIITNSHAVNQGRMPDCRPLPAGMPPADFYWVEQENPVAAAEMIVRLVTERIPKVYGFDPMADVQILSPMRKGECGTQLINERLQEALNPPGEQKETFRTQWQVFRTGDKVMQVKNNYDKGVFNGEQGRILFVDAREGTFTVQFDSTVATYDSSDSSELVLAYAVTVHKSQGSEYPVVILPVQTQHYIMLQRNLIYTGMTRAKKLLIMIGTYRALGTAVRNDRPMQRQTMLVERLRASR